MIGALDGVDGQLDKAGEGLVGSEGEAFDVDLPVEAVYLGGRCGSKYGAYRDSRHRNVVVFSEILTRMSE